MKKIKKRISTKIARVGLNPSINFGIPNPPVYHASTILYPNSKSRREKKIKFQYGRYGTPTSEAFCNAIADLYEADGSVIASSGLAAAVVGILSFVKNGNHILVTDSAYGSTRNFISKFLPTIGVEVEFYDPKINSKNLEKLFKKNTSLIYFESPGSLTFELQDLPELTKISKKNNITSIADNTWGTALGQNPLDLGVDVIIESFTKYVSGHSDVMMGGVIARGKYYRRIKEQSELMGQCTSPDDVYLAMRGLRTIEVRLEKSFTSSIKIANWIAKVPCVKNVYHPATKHHPDYMIFKRDFNIGAGLFSFELKQIEQSKIDKFIDSLELFGIGASWGGFESLVLPAEVKKIRRFDTFKNSALIRLAIGLENPDDLIDDLNRSFAKLD
tara:strand:- start:218 stop:1378 length:1161 start_codon:yes stop_codon:yes gene_type:complete